tara:strand:- start:402 stop:797 length:396 start_codon:yes stop_codon:yes gene_type:complete
MISKKDYPPGFEGDLKNISIDFDGVIHDFSKGYHDGTCYGKPLPGALESIKNLSKKYNIIIFTAKAKPSRPLVNGKTGTELVIEWLTKHNVMKYISEVTAEKPRSQIYIDDKGYRFENWVDTMRYLEENYE